MLSALERYCPNKAEGCEWTGQSDQVKGHYKTCTKKSRGSIAREIEEKDILIALLKGKLSASSQKYAQIEEENLLLKDENEKLLKKLQVYDAFFNHDKNTPEDNEHANTNRLGGSGNVADSKVGRYGHPSSSSSSSLSVPRSSNSNNSDASNLAQLRNFEKKSVYL